MGEGVACEAIRRSSGPIVGRANAGETCEGPARSKAFGEGSPTRCNGIVDMRNGVTRPELEGAVLGGHGKRIVYNKEFLIKISEKSR